MQSALIFGADLVSVFCAEEAAIPLKSYSPELMVTPIYSAKDISGTINSSVYSLIANRAANTVIDALPRAHSVVIGPGLGRSSTIGIMMESIVKEAKKRHMPYVCNNYIDILLLLVTNLEINLNKI